MTGLLTALEFSPDMGGAQPGGNNGGDPNVYDADFTDVDGNN